MTEGIAAFPTDPDMGPLNAPELLVALYLRMYGEVGKCDGAPLDCIEGFLADTYALGLRCLMDRGLVVPYEPPDHDALAVAWDNKALTRLLEESLGNIAETGLDARLQTLGGIHDRCPHIPVQGLRVVRPRAVRGRREVHAPSWEPHHVRRVVMRAASRVVPPDGVMR